MNILVFGANGQVGRALCLDPRVIALKRKEADLCNPSQCADVILQTNAGAIINAAAYTAVDLAETQPALAHLVNARAPAAMAHAAARKGIPLVHLSTDYVFDGSGRVPWLPDARSSPLSVYGSSKLAGEKSVLSADGPSAILRTSWVFSEHGSNFVKSMLRLGRIKSSLRVVADQFGNPTPAVDVAQAALVIAASLIKRPKTKGTYHYCGAGSVSWAGFARAIFADAQMSVDVQDIHSSQYLTLAERPKNSRLDCSTTSEIFGIKRSFWRSGLARVLSNLQKEDEVRVA